MRMGAGVAGLSGAGRRFGAFRDWACCVSVSTSIGEPENKKIVDLQAFQAADGTRTHDLLHGKQTVTAWAQPLSPCKYGAFARRWTSFFPRVSLRFDGIVSPNCPRRPCNAPAWPRMRDACHGAGAQAISGSSSARGPGRPSAPRCAPESRVEPRAWKDDAARPRPRARPRPAGYR
jgi:hypothetical protein